ncbi:hypothetical protein K9M47_01910 [Candidatus Gracilibacteria bacterium]|nr:hypothetical protein [Candidatus Gracilibacteria bacterium]
MTKELNKKVSYVRRSSTKNSVTEVVALPHKINDLLTEYYDKCCDMKNKGCNDYLSLNEDLIKQVEKVFNYYKSLKIEEYKIRKEKYGK